MEFVVLSFIVLFGGTYSASTLLLGRNVGLSHSHDNKTRRTLTTVYAGKTPRRSTWDL